MSHEAQAGTKWNGNHQKYYCLSVKLLPAVEILYQKIKLLRHIPILKMDSQWFTRIIQNNARKILKVKTRRGNGQSSYDTQKPDRDVV